MLVSNIEDRYQSCIHYYEELMQQDSYISKKDYQKFLDQYKDIFNKINQLNNEYKERLISIANNIDFLIDKHNKEFIKKKLIEYKDYFDHLFDDIDSSIILDDEQRKAILINEDYSLVIAGAGSGKTTTMTAKAKYLIDKCGVKPGEIAILSFTKKSVDELAVRINKDFNLSIPIMTFHKLGLSILNQQVNTKVSSIDDGGKWNLLNQYFKEKIFPNKEQLSYLINSFGTYLSLEEECLNYSDFNQYWDYVIRKRYGEEKENLKQYNDWLINLRLNKLRSIQNVFYRSQAEVGIANFLFRNQIDFEYEKKFTSTTANFTYKPDFTIILPNHKEIYIEYFGLFVPDDKQLSHYSKDEIERYRKLTYEKEKFHQECGTDLIELFPDDNPNTKHYLEKLEIELRIRNIFPNPLTEKEIFLTLMKSDTNYQFRRFINLVIDFIGRFKSRGYKQADFDILRKKASLENDNILIMQLNALQNIYNYYNDTIHNNHQVDFEDMINYAYLYMDKKPNALQQFNYKYIIVDEYQDISLQRFNLLQKTSNIFDAKIVAVGDDWQAIFGFSGADVQLFTKFCELMGYGEIVKITNTYRNSQELIDIAGKFILENNDQFEKHLTSVKHLENPIEILYYYYRNQYAISELLERVLNNLYSENPEQSILLLGRYRNDIEKILLNTNFREGIKSKGQIVYKKHSDMNITFLTVHSSKGLGYDQVILLNVLDDIHGFPSKKVDDKILSILNEENNEKIEFAEERRLFYVAITRTKNKVFILTPDVKISNFIFEIRNYANVYEHKEVVGEEELEII